MRIRSDLRGCVIVGSHILHPGDAVPDGLAISGSLLDATAETAPQAPREEGAAVKPSRADNKAAWFAFAEQAGLVEDGAAISDYSKADLIELVG